MLSKKKGGGACASWREGGGCLMQISTIEGSQGCLNKGGGGLFEPGGGGLFGGNSCCCFCLSVWGNSCWWGVLFHLAGGGCGPGPCLPIFCFFEDFTSGSCVCIGFMLSLTSGCCAWWSSCLHMSFIVGMVLFLLSGRCACWGSCVCMGFMLRPAVRLVELVFSHEFHRWDGVVF